MIIYCIQSSNYANVIANIMLSNSVVFPTIMYIDSNSLIKITNNSNGLRFTLATYWEYT